MRFKVNVFYIASAVCTLLFIGYYWFIFLPSIEYSREYQSIRTVLIFVTLLLLVAVGFQIFLAIKKEEEPS